MLASTSLCPWHCLWSTTERRQQWDKSLTYGGMAMTLLLLALLRWWMRARKHSPQILRLLMLARRKVLRSGTTLHPNPAVVLDARTQALASDPKAADTGAAWVEGARACKH